jgi:[acyl-carrier-protein] S-malonyltransferase
MTDGPAFVFPGQGSQAPGMGRELSACGPRARRRVDAAQQISRLPVQELMTVADAATIADPEIAQLLVFVWSTVWLEQLTELGVRPSIVAGHSLGEYSALVAAGSLEWETAVRLVAKRGSAMTAAAKLREGTMAAIVGLDPDVLAKLCEQANADHGAVNVANYNSPRQAVISGAVPAVEAVIKAARAEGALRAKRLAVGGAYHSPLMVSAEQALAPLLTSATLTAPRVPFVSSITGRRVTDIEAYRAKLLGQVTGPVRWQDTVRTLLDRGAASFLEVGPGRVLSGLGREMARQATHMTAIEGLRSAGRQRRTAQTA